MGSRKRQLFCLDDVVDILMNGSVSENFCEEENKPPPPKRTSLPQESLKVPVKLDSKQFYSSPKPVIESKTSTKESSRPPSATFGCASPCTTHLSKPSPLASNGRHSALGEKNYINSPLATRTSLPGNIDSTDSPKAGPAKWADIFLKPSPSTKKNESFEVKKQNSPFSSWLKNVKDKPGDTVTQPILDAGQKEFGIVQCPDCSMVYELKSPEDELLHMKHHDSLKEALKISVASLKNLAPIRVIDNGFQIYQVTKETPMQRMLATKVDAVLGYVKKELKAVTDQPCLEKLVARQKAFVCIDPVNSAIVGLCVSEPASRAFPAIGSDFPPAVEKDPRKTIAGVRVIWVVTEWRQKGIAKALMDCVRTKFVYGCVLSKREIAVSTPTLEGFNFFKGYIAGIPRPKEVKDDGELDNLKSSPAVILIYET